MKTLRRSWHRLLGTFSGRRSDDEFAAELETHRQLLIDEYERRGMPPEHARRAAALRLGSVATTADQYRDTRGLPSVDGVLQDLRVSIRGLRARPAFTLTCVLTLALAIGANVAIFSLIDRVVLHPLDVPDPSELVRLTLQGEVRGVPQPGTSMPWDMAQAFLGVPSLDNAALTSDASERAE